MSLNKLGLMKGKHVYLTPAERLLVAEWVASSLKSVEFYNKPMLERILKKLGASIEHGKHIHFT